MTLSFIKKAQTLLQSDIPLTNFTEKITVNAHLISQIRNGQQSFEQLTLADLNQLAKYYDIYGPTTESFIDQRLFLITFVMSRPYFYNGELAIMVRNSKFQPQIWQVIITNPTTFIDSIIDHQPFYQLLSEFAEFTPAEFQQQLKRYFICNIHTILPLHCRGYRLRQTNIS